MENFQRAESLSPLFAVVSFSFFFCFQPEEASRMRRRHQKHFSLPHCFDLKKTFDPGMQRRAETEQRARSHSRPRCANMRDDKTNAVFYLSCICVSPAGLQIFLPTQMLANVPAQHSLNPTCKKGNTPISLFSCFCFKKCVFKSKNFRMWMIRW